MHMYIVYTVQIHVFSRAVPVNCDLGKFLESTWFKIQFIFKLSAIYMYKKCANSYTGGSMLNKLTTIASAVGLRNRDTKKMSH